MQPHLPPETSDLTQRLPGAADLLTLWDPASRGTPQARLDRFVGAVAGAVAAQDTLGARHQRVMAFHRVLVGQTIDAQVTCNTCQTVNTFGLPLAALATAPAPDPAATAILRRGDAVLTFRLPRHADLAAGDPVAVLRRCYIGDGLNPVLSIIEIADLTRQFEHLDPAAVIDMDLTCAGCAGRITARAELARFVARDFDIAADALLHDIDTIARSYGWTEPVILALPAARRRRYVTLIAQRTGRHADLTDRPRPVALGRRT